MTPLASNGLEPYVVDLEVGVGPKFGTFTFGYGAGELVLGFSAQLQTPVPANITNI